MPLDLMSRNDQKEVLQALGVDVDELKYENYRKALIINRITEFCSAFEQVEKKRKEIGEDFGLRDTKAGNV